MAKTTVQRDEGAMLSLAWWYRKCKVLIVVSVFLPFVGLVVFPGGNFLYSFLEVEPDLQKSDAIIVLSAGHYTHGIFDRNTYQRIFHAYHLYRDGYADMIFVCGGTICPGQGAISLGMKRVLVNLGVSEDKIIIEQSSRNTYENLSNVRLALDQYNIKKSLLVTSSYHMFRSQAVAQKIEMNTLPAPVPCYEKDVKGMALRWRFLPEVLREFCAICYFKLHGWI